MTTESQGFKLYESFSESYKTGKYIKKFKDVYLKMVEDISTLAFTDCFVDLSNKRNRVDFNLSFDNDINISVARSTDSNDDIDMFSISRNKKTIVISTMKHKELIEKLKEIVPSLTNIRSLKCQRN